MHQIHLTNNPASRRIHASNQIKATRSIAIPSKNLKVPLNEDHGVASINPDANETFRNFRSLNRVPEFRGSQGEFDAQLRRTPQDPGCR